MPLQNVHEPWQGQHHTWADLSGDLDKILSQPRVGTETEAQAEMLNIQHYHSCLWVFLQSPEIPPCCEALTISLRIANSFSLVEVSRGETIVAYLTQNNHWNRESCWARADSGSRALLEFMHAHQMKIRYASVTIDTSALAEGNYASLFCFYDPLNFTS